MFVMSACAWSADDKSTNTSYSTMILPDLTSFTSTLLNPLTPLYICVSELLISSLTDVELIPLNFILLEKLVSGAVVGVGDGDVVESVVFVVVDSVGNVVESVAFVVGVGVEDVVAGFAVVVMAVLGFH